MTQEPQTIAYQAEVGRLLHLMVHSVYTDKDIFLRELISNASDACDKLRYEAISNASLLGPDERLAITIRPEPADGVLTIADNGIGMDREELTQNLGTIARSGTRAFLDKLGEAKDGTNLIGQFGVGFYSAFMVADEIEVISRKAGAAAANVWRSSGEAGFTVAPASAEQAAEVARGTLIRLKLKADANGYLEPYTLERIVKTYSDHIQFPVELIAAEPGKDDGGEAKTAAAPRQINAGNALWQRPKSEITAEQYTEAYRTIAGGYDEPLVTLHYKAEGRQAYAVLLFVPKERPFDLYDPARRGRVKLYVRRVYITDDAELLPAYLRFIRGVIDSEDVPLNISREMLQNNPMVTQIRKAVTGRVLSELEAFATRDEAGYATFIEAFGPVLKEGLYEDFERREQLLGLARFKTSAGTEWRSLKQYVEGLRPNQTAIYYLAGDNLDRLRASPQLEAARARGIEVLLLTDPVDSFWVTMRPDYTGKPFASLTQGDVDLSLVPLLEGEAKEPEADGKAAVLAAKMKEALGDKVSDVKLSKRLVTSAVCLVAPKSGPDLMLDRLMSKQERGAGVKPVLEINPEHALVSALLAKGSEAATFDVSDFAHLLLDQARILDGEPPLDPARFAQSMNRFMLKGV